MWRVKGREFFSIVTQNTKVKMKKLHVDKTGRIAMSQGKSPVLKGIITIAFLVMIVFAGQAQEKIFSIDAFTTEVQAVQGRMMAARTLSSGGGLDADQIAAFRNLYFEVQPAVYYNADGVNDAANGGTPTVVHVVPSALANLIGDTSRDFSVVRLLVIDGPVSVTLSPSIADKFPSLEFLVFKHNEESTPLNTGTTGNLIPNSFWEKLPDAVAIYNNLTKGQ